MVDDPFVGHRIGIVGKSVDGFRIGWQSDKVCIEAFDQSASLGRLARSEALLTVALCDERIEGFIGPSAAVCTGSFCTGSFCLGIDRDCRASGGFKGPVVGIFRAACDPTFEEILLSLIESPIGLRGGHEGLWVGRFDTIDDLVDGIGGLIESQIGLAFVGVLAVAVEAVLREDRSDIPIEIDRFGISRDGVWGLPECRSAALHEQDCNEGCNKAVR